MLTSAELVWLLAAVAKGDQAAFERLYAATGSKLYGVVLRILPWPDLAEQAMQESYLKIWNSAGQYDPAAVPPMTWMVVIGRNFAIDLARQNLYPAVEDAPEVMQVAANAAPFEANEVSGELDHLLACIGSLNEERRRLLLLAYYNGWSREQLASRFNRPVKTIETWLQQSLREIQGCLGS